MYNDNISDSFYSFNSFIKNKMKNSAKMNYNYLNINRQAYPKWAGWKLIESAKKTGLKIDEIDEPLLETLVLNHYMMLYIKTFAN